jgi:eukaryotic-like serine/threonine-protein kinase
MNARIASVTGDLLRGRYRVIGKLGQGGAAEVYDAIDVSIRRPVAIKVLLPAHRPLSDVRQRLLREGYLGALLGHPHVCGVSEIGTLDDGSPFLVMDRLTGRSVAERLEATGPLSVATVVAFGEQVLSALSAAHAHGIIHRDVKAANVFMATVNGLAPLAKLLDFGIALCPSELVPTRPDEAPLASQLTAAGMVVGTPHYMAPEQAEGRRDVDARVDIYQVGAFMYEALSGRTPCEGASYAELLHNIMCGRIAPLEVVAPSTPATLLAVVARALATSRDARFQSADQMLEALQATRYVSNHGGEDWEHTTNVDVNPKKLGDAGTTQPLLQRDRIR